MEWIYKRIWELKTKALTKENKKRIQMLQQMLDTPNSKDSDSEKGDNNNSANIFVEENSSMDKEGNTKSIEEEIDELLFNPYNR